MEHHDHDQQKDLTPWQGDYRELTIDDFAPEVKPTKPFPPINLRPKQSLAMVTYCSLIIILLSIYNWLSNSTYLLAVSFPRVIEDGEYWRVWTSLFIHSDFGHVASNLWLFGVFGYLLHAFWGAWVFPVISFSFIGGFTNLLTILWYGNATFIIGASGLVYGMIGLWLVTYCFFETRFSIATRIFRASGFTLIMLFPSTIAKNISYSAHSFGFIIGVLVGIALCSIRLHRTQETPALTSPQ